MTNDAGVFKKIYKSKEFKKVTRTYSSSVLEESKVGMKIKRSELLKYMTECGVKKAFVNVENIIFDYHIKKENTDGIQLVTVRIKEKIIDDDMFITLSKFFIKPTLFTIKIKKKFDYDFCYLVYDENSKITYNTQRGKYINFNYDYDCVEDIWDSILNTIKSESII